MQFCIFNLLKESLDPIPNFVIFLAAFLKDQPYLQNEV